MKITKIIIDNFKSIEKIEFKIKKYGSSYTTMFVGINESGKSNILEAMSFLDTPKGDFSYLDYCHQKMQDEKDYVDIYFYLEFENNDTYSEKIREKITNEDIFKFELCDVNKNIYLKKGENNFEYQFNFELKNFTKDLFIKKESKQENIAGNMQAVDYFELSKKNDEGNSFKELTEELFLEYFKEDIEEIIEKYEPKITFWKPTDEYLISDENLNEFSKNIDKNKALKNIFLLAGFGTKEEIEEKIKGISNGQQRSKLISKLQDSLNEYIKNVWHHDIDIIIEITETGKFTLSIKDKGEENKHDRLAIHNRSEGARHFLSLILSLSIENSKGKRKNQLILIDEPEVHLHPSGIRDLKNELLKIGKENFVFIATHSPFLIDRDNKKRNIIIKKNNRAVTEKREIEGHESCIDDEVLREAFGLEVYRDLLNPHSILVEGGSDKVILQKVFEEKKIKDFGITNGHGSNIDTLASKLNDSDISVLVILDDDKNGKKYKKNIIQIGKYYSIKNVFTIRDLVGEIVNEGTIEDTLGKGFIESKFKTFYKVNFNKDCSMSLEEEKPFINQIKAFLSKNDQYTDDVLESFKKKVSEEFNFPKTEVTQKSNFPLLYSLADKIIENLSK